MQNNKIFIGTPCYGGMLTADYFKSCIQEHDRGQIYTTLDALETRVKILKGIETDDPFIHHRTDPNLI